MSNNKIEVLANILEVNSKNLVSGDKEVRIKLSVVGASTSLANKLGDLQPGEMVRISYDPAYRFDNNEKS